MIEIALALVLLVGAGLLIRSFMTLMRVDPGFDPSHTVTMKVILPSANYREDGQAIAFFDRLFDRVDALPGVEAAGGVSFLPLNGLGAATSFSIEGRDKPRAGEEPVSEVKVITRTGHGAEHAAHHRQRVAGEEVPRQWGSDRAADRAVVERPGTRRNRRSGR